jgi:hypothetical protein
LQLVTGRSPILVLIAHELGQTADTLRKQLSDELKIDFEKKQANLEALYGKAKIRDAETFGRIIESKDWILEHPEIECLARIANIEIVIHPEQYNSPTGCKMVHTYNKDAPRGNIVIFRMIEGSVAKVSSKINEEAGIAYPTG